MVQTVLILGASGKIGRHAAAAFGQAGWNVRLYDRPRGDMTAQAQGAQVIVNGLNPPAYHAWDRLIPEITEQVITAAKASGATVIIPGNVYNFGDQPGEWGPDTPHRPVARKGHIRETMERRFEASGVQTIVLRGGDFISGTPTGDDVMGALYLRAFTKGRITAPADPDTMHAFCYLPDWAKAARLLAEKRADLPAFTELTIGGANFTVNEIKTGLEALTGTPLKVTRFPWWALTLAAPFWELARELREMRYLYDTPHSLSDTALRAMLPEFVPTPREAVLRAMLPRDVHPHEAMAEHRHA